MVAAEFDAEAFDGEVVVVALGQAGDGDAADDAGADDVDGEGAAVGGVVGVGEGVFFCEGGAALLKMQADLVGAAVEAGDDVGFALDPPGVVGRAAGECGVEEWLGRIAEAADIDDDSEFAGESELAEGEAEAPCGVVVEVGEVELGFLEEDRGEIFGEGHGGRIQLVGQLAVRAWGLRRGLGFADGFEFEIERDCSADKILQGRLIDLFAFTDVDGAPDISVEA